MPAAIALADVSKSVSAVSFGDLDLDANHVGGDVSWTPPENDAGIETYETYLATGAAGSGGARTGSMAVGTNLYAVTPDTDSMGMSRIVEYTKSTLAEQTMPAALALTDASKSVSAVSFGDLDLDANHAGGDVPWTPPENEAGIETYETYLATDAAGSGGALTGRMAAGSGVYAVPPDTDSMGTSHIVVYTKSTLAEQTMPAALALMGVSKSVSDVSFSDLVLDAKHVRGDVSWTSPENDAGVETYVTYLAADAAGSGAALTGGMAAGTNVCAVSPGTDSAICTVVAFGGGLYAICTVVSTPSARWSPSAESRRR